MYKIKQRKMVCIPTTSQRMEKTNESLESEVYSVRLRNSDGSSKEKLRSKLSIILFDFVFNPVMDRVEHDESKKTTIKMRQIL